MHTLASSQNLSRLGFILLIGFLTAGCGPSMYTVRGKVVYPDGTPMDGGWVVFEKTDGTTTHSADSPVKEDGTFELRTARPGDGVLPGKYRVLVKPKEVVLNEKQKAPLLIHRKYQKFETSGLEFVVEPKSSFFEIKVSKS